MKLTKNNVRIAIIIFFLVQLSLGLERTKKKATNKMKKANTTNSTASKTNATSSNSTSNSTSSNKTSTNGTNSTANSTNNSSSANTSSVQPLSSNFYQQLNTTLVIKKTLPLKDFKKATRKWDYKMLDKQLETIYQELKLVADPNIRPLPMRGFIDYFLKNYEACDQDGDNVLIMPEFINCMGSDTYFKQLVSPTNQTASFVMFTNTTMFYAAIFQLLDENNNGFLNFHDYMLLRLVIFSLKRCSVISPSIDLNHFSCSIERASGLRNFNKLSYKNLFLFGLEISNNESLRNLDFITYLYLTMSIRLYGKINGKGDADISLGEMRLAIDHNIMPARYSRNIIDQFFALVGKKKRKEGIDYRSFVFFDWALRLFTVNNATRQFYLAPSDFLVVLNKQYFPNPVMQAIKRLPQLTMTAESFQMQITYNTSQLYSEDDYLLKTFLESSSQILSKRVKKAKGKRKANTTTSSNSTSANKTNSTSNSTNSTNSTTTNSTSNSTSNSSSNSTPAFNLTAVAINFFTLLDADNDGYLTFQDFGHFMQLCYLYTKLDKTRRGLVPVGKIAEFIRSYNNYPKIADSNVDRSKRLQLLGKNLLLNIYEYLIVFRIDDLVKFYIRSDKKILFEIELKNLLKLCGLGNMPEMYLQKCVRGQDNKLPKYDWECAIVNGLTLMSNYYESVSSYVLAQNNNITLINTVFTNVDSQLTPAVVKAASTVPQIF